MTNAGRLSGTRARTGWQLASEGTNVAICDVASSAVDAPRHLDGRVGHRSERELFVRAHRGEARAREELTTRFMPLARSLALRYQRSGEPLDDLLQVAALGLVKAIDRFDPAREIAFSSYAVRSRVCLTNADDDRQPRAN